MIKMQLIKKFTVSATCCKQFMFVKTSEFWYLINDNMIYAIKTGKFLTQDDKMQHLV